MVDRAAGAGRQGPYPGRDQQIGEADGRIPRDSLAGLEPLVKPRTISEQLLVAIWQDILKIAPIGVEDRWRDLGGDAPRAIALFAGIEATFGVRMPPASLLEADTVAKLAMQIDPRAAVRRLPFLMFHRGAGKPPPLYCVHGVHGTTTFAFLLARHVGSELPIVGFQARGLSGIEEPHDRIEEMAADYVRTLRKNWRRGPYRLIGWCAGSLIALEMARRLAAEGDEITALILVDPPPRWDSQSIGSMVDEEIATLEGVRVVSELARSYRDAMIKTMAATVRAVNSYKLSAYSGALAILCSGENYPYFMDPSSEWRAAVRGPISVIEVAPTHMDVVKAGAPRLGAEVRRLLGSL